MILVGLTGSIAMGKSTVAGFFRERGAPVFDADHAVHALYLGEIAAEIEAAFPGATVEGAVDRQRLAVQVVGDAEAIRRLEAIVHPAVAAKRRDFLEAARRAGARAAVLDVPLLFETGAERGVDVVAVVSAPAEVQRARALARPGADPARFEGLLARQMPDVEKRRRAHFVIDTGGALGESRLAVEHLLRALAGAEGRHA